MARGLVEAGVAKGDRVSIYLPSDEVLRWIVAYAAVHKAGAVVVPTNTRLSVPELVTILGHAEVVALLTCEALLPGALDVLTELPAVKLVVSAGGDDERVASWDDVVHDDASELQVPVELSDLADVMYTSGTTGLPKGIAVRHRNVAMIPNHEPTWTGEGWMHGAPMFTFAGIAFIYNPMKMGLHRLLPTEVRRRPLAPVRRTRTADDLHARARVRGADRGTPRVPRARPVEPAAGVGGQRPDRTAHVADAHRPDPRRDDVELRTA